MNTLYNRLYGLIMGNRRKPEVVTGPEDPVERWLDHLAEVGSAAAMPEVSLPGLELG